MTGWQLANRIGAACIGGGLLAGAAVWFLGPGPAISWLLLANAAVAIWWGVHLLVTRRPW